MNFKYSVRRAHLVSLGVSPPPGLLWDPLSLCPTVSLPLSLPLLLCLALYLSYLSKLKRKLTPVFLIPIQLILVFSHDCNSSFQQEKPAFFIIILAPGELGHMPNGTDKTASL